jgi:Ni,Fe-hydrogenase III small subunit
MTTRAAPPSPGKRAKLVAAVCDTGACQHCALALTQYLIARGPDSPVLELTDRLPRAQALLVVGANSLTQREMLEADLADVSPDCVAVAFGDCGSGPSNPFASLKGHQNPGLFAADVAEVVFSPPRVAGCPPTQETIARMVLDLVARQGQKKGPKPDFSEVMPAQA